MDLKIAVLAGDGIGPEITAEALKVTQAVADKFGHNVTSEEGITGAIAIDKVGLPYPDETHELCMKSVADRQMLWLSDNDLSHTSHHLHPASGRGGESEME